MITVKRLLCVLLALATLAASAGLSASADSGAQVSVCAVQRLTPGTTFNPVTAPAVTNAAPGDIVVLTVAFGNDTAAAVDVAGFAAKILYDKTKVTPYQGTSPFSRNPYQIAPGLIADGWSSAGNSKDDFVMLAAASPEAYSVPPGSTLVLGRIAFQVNADASGAAEFTFDVAEQRTAITYAKQNVLTPAVSTFRLTLGGYAISEVASDHVTLSNPAPVTLAVARFDDAGKFLSASVQSVPANVGTVFLTTAAAPKIRAMLLDSDCRPLCVYE